MSKLQITKQSSSGALSKKANKATKKLSRKVSKQTRKRKFLSGLFITPGFLGVLLFFILPFLVVIFYSFVDNPISKEFVMFDNFKRIVGNMAFRRAVRNTALFSAISVPLAVILSLLLAIVLDTKLPFRSQFRTFFLSPLMVPVASIVLIWQVLFHYNGAVNDLLSIFGVDKIDWLKSDYALIVTVILFLWKNLGYNMILFMAALGSIPKDILEVARLCDLSADLFLHKDQIFVLLTDVCDDHVLDQFLQDLPRGISADGRLSGGYDLHSAALYEQ